MYQAVCDGCGKPYVNEELGYFAWIGAGNAMEEAFIAGWEEIDGKLYCPCCVEYDEETDSYKLKKKEK